MPVYHPIRRFEKKTGNTDKQTHRQTDTQKLTYRSSANFVSAGQKQENDIWRNSQIIPNKSIRKHNIQVFCYQNGKFNRA